MIILNFSANPSARNQNNLKVYPSKLQGLKDTSNDDQPYLKDLKTTQFP